MPTDKPSGIQIKVADFGIFGSTSGRVAESHNVGSLKYMAPEIHDKTVKYQGQDADCFAFGVSLFVARVIGYPWKVPDLIKDKDYEKFAGNYGINAEEFWKNFEDRELTEDFKNFIENLLAA